ncbi:MAG: ABC transporter substrate-binding protein [Nitrospinota bacterium]|nr:ABC transporter substrate-binding protein [Nitrospinota bacterium]
MRCMIFKKIVLAAICCAFALALTSGPARAQTKVVFIHGAEPKSLDNALHPAGSADNNIQTSLYDSLTFHRLDGTIEGRLAESWKFLDPTTIIFKLRKGVKFHDGTPFNAAAVKFSLMRTIGHKRARLRKWITMIKGIRVIDDHTIEMKLKFAYAPILLNLGTPVAAIGSPTAIKKYGKKFRRNPVGTGPFIFVKWVPGEFIRFRANPDYWDGKPKIDILEFRLVPEDTTRVLQLRSGQAQLAMFLPPAQLNEIEKDPKLDLVKAPLFRVIFIGLSMLHKPFDNLLVRKAMNYAIDNKTIIEKVMLGVGTPIRGPFGPKVWGYDPDFEKMGYTYNPEKAKALLKQAGYPNGFETEFWHPTGRYTMDKVASEAIQAQLAKVGVRVKLRTGSWGLVAPTIRKGKAPMFFYGWGASTGDADMVMYQKFHSNNHGRSGNYTRYKNPAYEKVVVKARQLIDPAARKALYKKAAKMLMDDPPWIFFKQEVMLVGKSKKLKGVIIHPGERIYWRKAYLEK